MDIVHPDNRKWDHQKLCNIDVSLQRIRGRHQCRDKVRLHQRTLVLYRRDEDGIDPMNQVERYSAYLTLKSFYLFLFLSTTL